MIFHIKKRVFLLFAPLLFGGGLFFGFWGHVSGLYQQLEFAFLQEEQFVPTRIYSNVTRIHPGQTYQKVETILTRRGYAFLRKDTNFIAFELRPQNYPSSLLPTQHPLLSLRKAEEENHRPLVIQLSFGFSVEQEEEKKELRLESPLLLNGTEIPDLYLEPELITTFSSPDKKNIRTSIPLSEVPAPLWQAIIAIEDPHFLEHSGFDPRGVARAIWVNVKTRSFAQGGSTLTQQLVKNLMIRRSKNFFQKLSELFLSIFLELRFSKEKILERYLNEVYLGQIGNLEVHGVTEGARSFFNKKLNELNLAEMALMAGLIRGPGFYSPYQHWDRAIQRQKKILQKMIETQQIAKEEAEESQKQPIRLAPPLSVALKAPFFTDYVKYELQTLLKDQLSEAEIIRSGFQIYTTLESDLNQEAQKAVSTGIESLEKKFPSPSSRLEGALACVHPETGSILALVGGKNYSKSNFNRILNMKRQVGSLFKPLVYLTAILQRKDPHGRPYGGGTLLEDAPWTLILKPGRSKKRQPQTWSPKNYEKTHRGWITLREALAHSVNTTTARLGYELGISKIIETAQLLGIESPLPAVPSLALGVAELSPLEILKVYALFANRGTQTELRTIRHIAWPDETPYLEIFPTPGPSFFDTDSLDLLTDLLQSVLNEGTARSARSLGFHLPAAGKTGTTNDHRDAWFAGYTPQLATVVWVGLDTDKGPLLTGANAALPIWVQFMKSLSISESQFFQPFPPPPHLVEVGIDLYSGEKATENCPPKQVRMEKWIEGNSPEKKDCAPHPPSTQALVTQEGNRTYE